jgi:peroxiredoxin
METVAQTRKRPSRNILALAIVSIVLVASAAVALAYANGSFAAAKGSASGLSGNVVAKAGAFDDISSDGVYGMFLCPCCGEPLDKASPCCGMAQEMIDFIDSQIASGMSKDDVILGAAKKFGLGAVVEAKKSQVRAMLEKSSPELFPEGKLSFSSAVGKEAPDFTLESIEGGTVKLSDYTGKNVILFFNEGSMCYPACWDQAAALGSDARLNNDATVAFSIMPDQRDEWLKIVQQVPKLKGARLLFDSSRAVSDSYDVLLLPSSMHKGSSPGHTYFIIDKAGIVRYVLDDPTMSIQNEKLAGEINRIV